MPDAQPSQIPTVSSAEMASSETDVTEFMTRFLERLRTESLKNQLQIVEELATAGETGLQVLMQFLNERQACTAGLIEGKVYQTLVQTTDAKVQEFLSAEFPQGIVPLRSQQGLDYLPLQRLLAQQDFQAADRLTLEHLCQLAGPTAVQRKWLYFTEVEKFPMIDLQTIDQLWRVHSIGRFGFSVQRELWLATGKNWDKLWPQIGWRNGNNWTRYPQEFIWDLSAPKGHLPLSNQLRGVRVMAALLTHPAWEERS